MTTKKRLSLLSVLLSLAALTTATTANAVLSATTNTIQGTAPYIELNGVKATDLSSLLSIRVGSDTYVSDAAGNMSKVGAGGALTPVTLPITLANAGDTFASVGTIVAPDTTAYSLNLPSVIPNTARKDDDGDNTFTISGNLKGEWKDKNGNAIAKTGAVSDLTQSPKICNAPYTLTLTTTGGPSISTQYGAPRQTVYGNSSAKFTLNPVSVPTICYAKPNLQYGTGNYAGPAGMWDSTNGFIPQATAAQNFPTTGANGLYFDLDIGGVSTALTWPPVTVGNITATMSNATATSVRVTLTGPDVARGGPPNKENVTGTTAPVPSVLPAMFELKGNSGGATVLSYGFELKKWYVNRGDKYDSAVNQTAWCSGLAGAGKYVLPKVKDLTNASGGSWVVALPGSGGNYYKRYIGGGLFSEWGDMGDYTRAGFVSYGYWTSDTAGSNQFNVYSHNGNVNSVRPALSYLGVCVHST